MRFTGLRDTIPVRARSLARGVILPPPQSLPNFSLEQLPNGLNPPGNAKAKSFRSSNSALAMEPLLGISEAPSGFFSRQKLDYHFVEISPHLAKQQQEKNKGTWHTTLSDTLVATRGSALIISNEFFDAFPVRIFNQALEELYLGPKKEEIWQPCHDIPNSSLFKELPLRFEVADSIAQWFRSDLSKLKKGEVLSLDYGGDSEEIYHRRPLGTLRAYAHHMRLLPPDAYQNPGKQDLTFDVYFPDLIEWGEKIGLETESLITQAEFLGTNDLEGAGGAFKVLHQKMIASQNS